MTAARVVVVLVLSAVELLGGLLAVAAPVPPPKEEEKNAVEKDGVRFEVVVPQCTWSIPDDKPVGTTPVKLALRITNRTKGPLRFTRFDTLTVEMVGPDGKDLQSTAARKGTRAVQEADCPLAKPGESVVFDIDAHLFWRDSKLWFGGADGFGGGWGFANACGPGRYQLRIRYRDATPERTVVRGERSVLEGFWTGDVRTPLVKVVLTVSTSTHAQGAAPAETTSRSPENQVFQFMATASQTKPGGKQHTATAYLWIPEQCRQVRGIVVAGRNVPEHWLVGHAAIRQACAASDLAILWSCPTFFDHTIKDGNYERSPR